MSVIKSLLVVFLHMSVDLIVGIELSRVYDAVDLSSWYLMTYHVFLITRIKNISDITKKTIRLIVMSIDGVCMA